MDKKIFIIGIALILVFGGVIAFFVTKGKAVAVEETIEIPLSEVTDTAEFYEYDSGGKIVRYFAVKADDGSVKTGFDACDVCHAAAKGYRQEGDQMVCNNCGNRYPISGLGTENTNPGGCWPGYLPNYIEGDNLIIKTSDLENGEVRFA